MNIGFGLVNRNAIDGLEMKRLIDGAQQEVQDFFMRYVGGGAPVFNEPSGYQYWQYLVPSGNGQLQFVIESYEKNPRRKLTWEEVSDVLQGLDQYLIDGKRFWETKFNVMDGRWPFPTLLATGYLTEVPFHTSS